MTPADKRMLDLLDKWLTSLELHLKYANLDDDAYGAVQPWPKHDRPTRWIIELARQKTLELKGQHESRLAMGDGKFAEALELMGFLANLVGSQNVQRFIPLAERDKEQKVASPAARNDTANLPTPDKRTVRQSRDMDTTREMPRLPADARKAAPPSSPKQAPAPRPATKPAKKPAAAPAPAKSVAGPAMQKKVMADAVRLLKWGREWHELAELIARLADRPPAGEVRKILRSHKTEIELQAGGDE